MGHCDMAYIKACEDEGGRTVDAMRILLTFGLDHITRSVENKPCQNETVQQSVRRLLKALVELSQNEPDPISSKKVDSSGRCSAQTRQICQIEVPMKQGDWICPKSFPCGGTTTEMPLLAPALALASPMGNSARIQMSTIASADNRECGLDPPIGLASAMTPSPFPEQSPPSFRQISSSSERLQVTSQET
ncbi:hypothetical protein Ancab_018395 [Ancistrocladus abbreviatus]